MISFKRADLFTWYCLGYFYSAGSLCCPELTEKTLL